MSNESTSSYKEDNNTSNQHLDSIGDNEEMSDESTSNDEEDNNTSNQPLDSMGDKNDREQRQSAALSRLMHRSIRARNSIRFKAELNAIPRSNDNLVNRPIPRTEDEAQRYEDDRAKGGGYHIEKMVLYTSLPFNR